ncbi:hypothetical protein SAMN05216311_107293 [Chitinophaga sp. CF418]|nr:hypothetical protein SAMN05216311_107293 [Chitinophaga sp. CF418]
MPVHLHLYGVLVICTEISLGSTNKVVSKKSTYIFCFLTRNFLNIFIDSINGCNASVEIRESSSLGYA